MNWAQFINNFIKSIYQQDQWSSLNMLPRHTNIMTEKGFSLLWWICCEMCTSVPTERRMNKSAALLLANSQKILTKINKKGSIDKTRIWVESDTVKYFKAFLRKEKIINNLSETLHFGTGALRWICCIFPEHLFLRTFLDGWSQVQFWSLLQLFSKTIKWFETEIYFKF